MAAKNNPSIDEWRQLYDTAVKFKNAGCWNWMYGNDIFGVQDPESREIYYCTIMGSNGEHFALAAYRGAEGLSQIISMISGEVKPGDFDIAFTQNCLMCSFEDRDFLEAQDTKIIKELGLRFRGKSEWPCFRDYKPGLFPWFLTSDQCRFLTHALSQALDVSLICRKDKDILYNDEKILVRTPSTFKSGEIVWEDKYLPTEFPDIEKRFVSISINNELLVKKLKSLPHEKNIVFEADTFFAPAPVKEKGRPYFPKLCIILEQMTGLIIAFELFKDIKTEGSTCIDMLIDYIEKTGSVPSKLVVARDETYFLFIDICRQLGIELEMAESLCSINEVKNDLFEHLSYM